MRSIVVAALTVVQTGLACAIFACSLQLSHTIVANRTLGRVAHAVVNSTRRLASVKLHIRLGDA